ncbi:hypothetical protein AB1Y20_004913 [Prymnesium parvum]|uniref:Reticulon-like protein n=1 Tax=Prymnesium parvum TaxID=97485 RepID=A0AB34J0K1_PRYPA
MASPLADRTNSRAHWTDQTTHKPIGILPPSPEKAPPPPPIEPPPCADETAADASVTECANSQPARGSATKNRTEGSSGQFSAQDLRKKLEHLSALGVELLRSESSFAHYMFAGGQLAFAFTTLGDISLLRLLAWAALLYLLYGARANVEPGLFAWGCPANDFFPDVGGVASTVRKPGNTQPPLTEADLQPYLAQVLFTLNQARELHRTVFQCADPKQALKGATVLYAIAILSSRLRAVHILWIAFTLAFTLPTLGRRFETKLEHAKAEALVKALEMNALLEQKCPKKYLCPVLALLWTTYSSYSTMALTIGIGCISIQAWRASDPFAEAELKGISSSADAAFVKIRKKAHRLSISAKDMVYGSAYDSSK